MARDQWNGYYFIRLMNFQGQSALQMMTQERGEIKESRDMKSSDRKKNILVKHCSRKNRATERELPMHLIFLKVEWKLLWISRIRHYG